MVNFVRHAAACAGRGTLPNRRKKFSACLPRNGVERNAAGFGQHIGGVDDKSRLVAFAAMLAGREIRRIGLDQNAVGRKVCGDVAQRSRILERQNAGERDEMPERDGPAGEVGTAGKAMQHGGEGALPCFLFEDARHVVIGVARMDHQRQPGFARRRDVIAKTALLRLARRVVVVVVEAGLADRHDFGMPRARDQIARGHMQFLVGIVRMGPDRAEHVREALGDRQHLGMARNPRRDGDQAGDAGSAARDRPRHRAQRQNPGNRDGNGCRSACFFLAIAPFFRRARHNAETPPPAPAALRRERRGVCCRDKQTCARRPARPEDRAIFRPTPA